MVQPAAAGPQPGAEHLRLDRRLGSLDFQSWRLSSGLAGGEGTVALPPGTAAAPPFAVDTDYVAARHAALLNALTLQPRGCYAFLEGCPSGRPALARVELGEPGAPPVARRVCGASRRCLPVLRCCCQHSAAALCCAAAPLTVLASPPAPRRRAGCAG